MAACIPTIMPLYRKARLALLKTWEGVSSDTATRSQPLAEGNGPPRRAPVNHVNSISEALRSVTNKFGRKGAVSRQDASIHKTLSSDPSKNLEKSVNFNPGFVLDDLEFGRVEGTLEKNNMTKEQEVSYPV